MASDPTLRVVGLIEDRGPALYGFHGRHWIREHFAKVLHRAFDRKGGTVFLIQGPPGAGKSALLTQLGQEAKKWRVMQIVPSALWDPSKLARAGGRKGAARETRGSTITGGGGLGGAGTSFGRTRSREYAGHSIADLFKAFARRKKGVLLVLDEAQNVADLVEDAAVRAESKEVLHMIHAGQAGVPVVLLAGGLGDTQKAFGLLGISRFHGATLVNLGRLQDPHDRAMIAAWLEKGARISNSQEGYSEMLQEILSRSYGWPQHLAAYGEATRTELDRRGSRKLSHDVCQSILRLGDHLRVRFYEDRSANLKDWERAVLGLAVGLTGTDSEWNSIALERVAQAFEDRTTPTDQFIDRAVAKGVLAQLPSGSFHIPIPSMSEWLVTQAHEYNGVDPADHALLEHRLQRALR